LRVVEHDYAPPFPGTLKGTAYRVPYSGKFGAFGCAAGSHN